MSYYESVRPPVHPWFFHVDYSRSTLWILSLFANIIAILMAAHIVPLYLSMLLPQPDQSTVDAFFRISPGHLGISEPSITAIYSIFVSVLVVFSTFEAGFWRVLAFTRLVSHQRRRRVMLAGWVFSILAFVLVWALELHGWTRPLPAVPGVTKWIHQNTGLVRLSKLVGLQS